MNNQNSNGNVWVDSLWTTRKESVTIKDGDDEITREISVGMSVKSDNRTPSAVLHEKLDQALSKLIEDEKDKWLTEELIKRERTHLRDSIEGMDELVNGNYRITDESHSHADNGNGKGHEAEVPKGKQVHLMF